MDFDHLRDKVANVSKKVLGLAPKEKILAEIAKCELVCCLCHNLRTEATLKKKFPDSPKCKKPSFLRNLEIIAKAKSCPCAICGVQREQCNMQFDHIDQNNKTANVCNLKSAKEQTLLAEIAKCQVICALCHRKKSIVDQLDRWNSDINV